MRWLFFILLLANLVFFGVMQSVSGRGGEPMAAHKPLNADRMKLLTPEQVRQLPEQKRNQVASADSAACLEWGAFAGDELARAQEALQKLELEGDRVTQRRIEQTKDFWVFIPPLKSRPDALKKVDELKALGVEESYVLQDSSTWRNAVSLGVFSTEEAAAKYLAQLREKGVKSAKTVPRTHENGLVNLVIRQAGGKVEAELVKLKQEFPGSELKAVDCK